VAAGADVDAVNYEGEAALHWAVLRDRWEVAEVLLGAGADTEIRESYGRTPLLLVARETGSLEMARRLLKAGADVNARDRSGSTPLELAAWRGFRELVDLLLDRGAHVPGGGEPANGLLREATVRGLDHLFGLVVRGDVDLEMRNDNGGTLLHSAAAGGSVAIAEMLLERGLPVNARDRYGRTALHYAAENGRSGVVRLLLEWGADPGVRSLAGHSPLNSAEAYERVDAAGLLIEHGAAREPVAFPVLSGPWLGQAVPGREAVLFAPDIVSTHAFQHGTVAFSPDGTEAFWSSSLPEVEPGYSYGRIVTSRLENGRWTEPAQAPFSRQRIGDDVPFFHPDGSKLFFISARGGDGEHLWWVERTAEGWSAPHRVEGGPNLMGTHWQFSVAADGSIYFNSADPGGAGGGDLYVSHYADGRYVEPVSLGAPINSAVDESSPFIAPDESYLIFVRVGAADGIGRVDLYISFRNTDGSWTDPRNMGPRVNTGSNEICPMVSPDGRYFFFNSYRSGNADNYWMDASVIADLRGGG
jgi:ankyrin repeat protein